MEFVFRPLTTYPKPRTKDRRKAPFSGGYGKTLINLDRELVHLRAKSVVIQADCTEDDIRLDGRIRSSATMRSPAIVLTIELPDGPMSMPCDTYLHWTDNLRAITLTLERLRAIDRYGVTTNREQYRGWKALPAGSAIAAAEWSSVEDAARFLVRAGGAEPTDLGIRRVIDDPEHRDLMWKAAAKKHHPDTAGPNETMAKVNRAKDYIDRGGR